VIPTNSRLCLLCRDLLQDETDRKIAEYILNLIREEEKRSDELKRQAKAIANVAKADTLDLNGIASEQLFNREQTNEQEVQVEQEQVSWLFCQSIRWNSVIRINVVQEQEKEREKEEEKVDEIEEEEFVRQKYCRDDEEITVWNIDELANRPQASKLNYYPLNQFSIFKNVLRPNETLRFPDFLWVSRNHFHLEWTLNRTLRRLKNVIIILEWEPRNQENGKMGQPQHSGAQSTMMQMVGGTRRGSKIFGDSGADSTISFTTAQERSLERCFNMFDVDGDGKLSTDDIEHVGIQSYRTLIRPPSPVCL
jgi:hypothetical protein